jgi:hypothetical protein
MGYAMPAIVLGLFAIYYFNGTQSILNPTAHQTLTNNAFVSFIIMSSVLLGIVLVSVQTKSPAMFLSMLAAVSFVWYIYGKSWQYTPV